MIAAAHVTPRGETGVAAVLGPVARELYDGELPVRLRAWDGTETGPQDRPVVVLRHRNALRRALWHPGQLGLAQAYATGELEIEGDLTAALRAAWPLPGRGTSGRPRAAMWPAIAAAAVRLGLAVPPPPASAVQVRVAGHRPGQTRDQAVTAGRYDVSAEFCELILGETMAYSCGWWRSAPPGYDLADAQRHELELICRRLGLRPGHRLLDLGCGWGALAMQAATRHDAEVTAVTLAGNQGSYARKRAAAAGLGGRVHVRVGDYRGLTPGSFDAIACIETGEHVRARAYPRFCAQLAGLLRPGGRLLVQQMAHGGHIPGGKFIQAFIARDKHMRPVGHTVATLENAGLEVLDVHAMREHYTRTIRAWQRRLERRFGEAAVIIGSEAARAWRLYLAGAALAFEDGRMGLHQILAAAPSAGRGAASR